MPRAAGSSFPVQAFGEHDMREEYRTRVLTRRPSWQINATRISYGRASPSIPAFDYFFALRRVREYFETNYTDPISLKNAASVAGLE